MAEDEIIQEYYERRLSIAYYVGRGEPFLFLYLAGQEKEAFPNPKTD